MYIPSFQDDGVEKNDRMEEDDDETGQVEQEDPGQDIGERHDFHEISSEGNRGENVEEEERRAEVPAEEEVHEITMDDVLHGGTTEEKMGGKAEAGEFIC